MRRALSYRASALAVPLLMAASAGPVAASAAPGTAHAAARAGTTQAGAAAGPSVFAWGDNSAGELGDGTLTGTAVPVAVGGLAGVRAISAAGRHELALRANGTVLAWGDDTFGQLGNGIISSNGDSEVPVAVPGLSTVTAVAAGEEHSLALLTAGPRDIPARQQTLRGTIDWSYNLLGPDARKLLARLAVFRGRSATGRPVPARSPCRCKGSPA